MRPMSELIPVLQIAIGPVILISGVGLLLLTMTNRLGRVIDRARTLVREMKDLAPEERPGMIDQIGILSHRASLLQRAIVLASLSVLLAAVLVITLFVTALFGWENAWLISGLFVGGMACLIASLVGFIQDIDQSLVALRLDLGEAWPSADDPALRGIPRPPD
jgi:hypothetical protein